MKKISSLKFCLLVMALLSGCRDVPYGSLPQDDGLKKPQVNPAETRMPEKEETVVGRFTNEKGEALSPSDTQVKDNRTGLIWMRAQSGWHRTWSDSAAYCANFEPHDRSWAMPKGTWRLPTRDELATIFAAGKRPAIDYEVFPGSPGMLYWTSTYDEQHVKVWAVDFIDDKASGYYAPAGKTICRCVRR